MPAEALTSIDPITTGLRLLIEDSQGELLALDVPSGALGSSPCGFPRDGWKVRGASWSYTNRSSTVSAQGCAPGSASGLRSVSLADRRPTDGIRYSIKLGPVPLARLPATPVKRIRVSLTLGTRPDPDLASAPDLTGLCGEMRLVGSPLRERSPGPFCRPTRVSNALRALDCTGP